MRTYCTLFDRNYLYQAIALHHSLERWTSNFRLVALCMDATSYAVLQKMQSATLVPLSVDEMMTPEAAEVRERTTHGQFCWVSQPLVCEFVLDRFKADMVTYLEADSLFFSDPEQLFDELSDGSVSLVPHNFSSSFDNSAAAGKFCVQFNAFRNDAAARGVLEYWKRCCFRYDKSAPTVYPGQTSLDDWATRFDGVHEIRHLGAGVAPWNIRGYELDTSGPVPHVNGLPVVFFHFHQYGRYKSGAHELGSYPLTGKVIDCFYRPYVGALKRAEASVRAADGSFSYRREYAEPPSLATVMRERSRQVLGQYFGMLKRRLRGRYNVYPDGHFCEQ